MLNYIKRTLGEHLVVKSDAGFNIAKWFVDAAFAVHPDFKLHTDGCLIMSEQGGAVVSLSKKQKLNTRSSTEAKSVGVDDAVSKIMWVQEFLQAHGFVVGVTTLYQDNQPPILLRTPAQTYPVKIDRTFGDQEVFLGTSFDFENDHITSDLKCFDCKSAGINDFVFRQADNAIVIPRDTPAATYKIWFELTDGKDSTAYRFMIKV